MSTSLCLEYQIVKRCSTYLTVQYYCYIIFVYCYVIIIYFFIDHNLMIDSVKYYVYAERLFDKQTGFT